MKSIILRAAFVTTVALSGVALSGPATAGVVFEIETIDHAQSRAAKTQVFAQGRQLKMTVTPSKKDKDQSPSTMIFDAERRELIIVDDRMKSYSVLDDESIEAMADRIKAMRHEAGDMTDQMQDMLDKVPEAQRAQVKKMMEERMGKQPKAPDAAQASPPKSEIKRSGEKKTQHGFATTRYDVYQDKQKVSELWVTSWDKIEGGKEVSTLFGEMADFMKDMVAKVSREAGAPNMMAGRSNNTVFEHMKEIGGFPVVSRVLEDGEVTSESTLLSAKRQKVDAAAFQPPKGFKKRSLMDSAGPPQDHSGHGH